MQKQLENNASKLQEKIDDLEGKIDSNANIGNTDTSNNNNNTIKIEGEYHVVGNDNSEVLTYKFEGNTVKFIALYTTEGTYEIVDNKIKITYSKAYDMDGELDTFPNGKYEELTIVDENTLTSQKTINGVVYNGKYVKDSKFVSENPKISFQYPNDWTIETNSWNIWNRTVKAPETGIDIIITKEENKGNGELKDLISLDWGSNVLDEGTISTANNYKNYFKTYTFADAYVYVKAKDVMIDTGKGDYYLISLVSSGDTVSDSKEEADEKYEAIKNAFEKYEPVLNKLVSSVQF